MKGNALDEHFTNCQLETQNKSQKDECWYSLEVPAGYYVWLWYDAAMYPAILPKSL